MLPDYRRLLGLAQLISPICGTILVIATSPGLAQTTAVQQVNDPLAAPVAPPALPAADESSYILGAGDQVQIDLFRLPQYSGAQEIQVDGSLNLPLVGSVRVGGLAVDRASAAISAAYSQVLRRPLVTLSVLQRRPLDVGIAGEVERPGSYTLTPNNTIFPTITQLLETAGGITQSADLRRVEVRRQRPDGGQQVIPVDLWQLLENGDARYNISLRDGDSIVIPSTINSLAQSSLLADASFYADTAEPITIAVVGEVFRPGPYTLRGGSTRTREAGQIGQEQGSGDSNNNRPVKVTDAIQVAGGIKPMANIRQVRVRRRNRSGLDQTFEVDLWQLLQSGDLRQNAILQEGDTVVVPTATDTPTPSEASQLAEASFAPDTISVNVVGEVRRSGPVEVPPNTPLNQAILAAGGFNTRAREESVLLVRLNPDGTVSQQEIPVDFAEGIDQANNPVLQNNDIVIVAESGLAGFSDTLGNVVSPLSDLLFLLGAPFRALNLFD